MKEIDLNKYKTAWKSEQSFENKKLSETDINSFLKKKSKDISSLFVKTLTIDIILKSIFAVSFLHIAFLYLENPKVVFINILVSAGTAAAIFFQIKTLKKIPRLDYYKENMNTILESKIDFYSSNYFKSHYVGALTNPMLFISGSLYYYYFRYGSIPSLSILDYSVLCVFISAGFIIGVYVQIKYHEFHIHQLKECLSEIKESRLNEITIKDHNKKRIQIIFFSLFFIMLGLIMLIFLI